jgi:hypothetical protein
MINLVPDNIRANNKYAYRNVLLLRYTALSALTMAAIGVITGLSILGMLHSQNNLQGQINDQNTKLATYKTLDNEGEKLSTQITTIGTLLNRQVTFSTLLPGIAKTMPRGAILKELDFSTSDILPTAPVVNQPQGSGPGSAAATAASAAAQKPFIILAAVSDRSVAATLLNNVKAQKDLFTDADLVEVTQTNTGSSASSAIASHYPYQVTINAYLKKLNPSASNKTSGASR